MIKIYFDFDAIHTCQNDTEFLFYVTNHQKSNHKSPTSSYSKSWNRVLFEIILGELLDLAGTDIQFFLKKVLYHPSISLYVRL